jgi:hypothetical protein
MSISSIDSPTVGASAATHPILAAASGIHAVLDEVREVQPAYMAPAQKEAALADLATAQARLAELELRIAASADDVAAEHGARDVGPWLADHLKADPGVVRRRVSLARALDHTYDVVRRALGDGRISEAKAQVIVTALDDLPDDLDPDTLAQAERLMVDEAPRWSPSTLRVLGRKLLHTIAPEIADEEEAKRLEDEERDARRRTSLNLRPCHDGTTRLSGLIPDADAERLRTYLDSFTSPRNQRDDDGHRMSAGEVSGIPAHRRRGQALCALLERLDPDRLPEHGGDATTVVVTMTLDQLRAELATAGILGSDTEITAAQARRLACTASVIPAVLGGKGEVLDLGRSQRLFSAAQRKALRLMHRHCQAEGCDIPARWCEAHHDTPWSRGGRTDLAHARLYCSWHHHRAHDPTYEAVELAGGQVRFRRRR